MNDFSIYFPYGFEHIVNWQGLDHILFVAALCIRYEFADWRKILVLVTAFTIGHSVTLALSVFDVIDYSIKWIEFLIPITIVITAISNAFVKKFTYRSKFPLIYFLALFFGLIHGLGFSAGLRSLLGKDTNIVGELLAFNLGLEAGQVVIVLIVLLISYIFIYMLKCARREYILYFSGGIFAIALEMAVQRSPFF